MNKLAITLLFVGALTVVSIFWLVRGATPANPTDKSLKMFVIPYGEPLREIANKLKREGLIKDPIVFFLLVKNLGLDKKIQAGDYRLSSSMSAKEVAAALTLGIVDIWVTIPEGKRALEIAEILEEKIPSYDLSWADTLSSQEGYLFPDTYLIPKDATVDLILSQLKGTFAQKYETLENKTNKSQEEIVTIASLIEREARRDEDRALVASVIYNRLALGMGLQIDATVQYALGFQTAENNWWKRHLSANDIALNSPYNTYRNPGLPPTPICSPGLKSLRAAVNPAQTDYLYYLSDNNGINHYAKTLAEHNTNIKKYGL